MERPVTAPGAGSDGRIESLDAEGGAKLLRSIAMVTHCVADLDVAREAWSSLLGYVAV